MNALRTFNKQIEKYRYENRSTFYPFFIVKDAIRGLQKIVQPPYKVQMVGEYKALYFPIQKVANSALRKKVFGKLPGSKKFRVTADQLQTRYQDHFKFAFVRNPFDRLVSCYLNKLHNSHKSPPTHIDGAEVALLNTGNFYPQMPFDDFIKAIYEVPDEKANVHCKSQHAFITDKNGNLLVDKIYKFESLGNDYEDMASRIGLLNPPPLVENNKSSNRESFASYYTEELADLVVQRFKKDFELFGYSPQLKQEQQTE